MDSFRFVVCGRADCRRVFFLCRQCDRGDRYCSRPCAQQARHATLDAAARRYQQTWRGRLHHAARQARYRARRENVTHQTSQPPLECGIVFPPPAATVTPAGAKEAPLDADRPRPTHRPRLRCARCGRPGRFLRHVTLAHVRPPRPTPRR